MNKNFNYKKKFQLAILVIALTFYIIYSLAIKKTISLYSLYSNQRDEMILVENAPVKMAKLNMDVKNISSFIGKEAFYSNDLRQNILDKASQFCENSNSALVEMPESVIFNKSGYNIVTNSIIIQGSFAELLNFIYLMEQKYLISKVISCRFYSIFDKKTNTNNLFLEIYLQNIDKAAK
jgi:hypothetical protein